MRKTVFGNFEGKELMLDGKPLEVNYLRGDFGKNILEKVDSVYGNYSFPRGKIIKQRKSDIVYGASPYTMVAINDVLKKEGLRIANKNEISKLCELDLLDEIEYREDDSSYVSKYSWRFHHAGLIKHIKSSKIKQEKINPTTPLVPFYADLCDLKLLGGEPEAFFELSEDANFISFPDFKKNGIKISKNYFKQASLIDFHYFAGWNYEELSVREERYETGCGLRVITVVNDDG